MKFRNILRRIRKKHYYPEVQIHHTEKPEADPDILRGKISTLLEAADPPRCQDVSKQSAVVEQLSQLIWSKLEQQAILEEQLNSRYWAFGRVEQLQCETPSVRQLSTAEWFIKQVQLGDKRAAFHYLNEYVDNYHCGFEKECSAYELQVIWMMLELIKIVGVELCRK